MYGKDKENRPGQKFSEWVQEMFPGLGMSTVPDALWFAEFSTSLVEIPVGMSNPQSIRKWFNEQQATSSLPSDAPSVSTVATPKFASKRDAEKFIKLDELW